VGLGDFVNWQVLPSASTRFEGCVAERVSGDFSITEVGSVYDRSCIEELRVGGVRLLHFAGSMLTPSIRVAAADVLPGLYSSQWPLTKAFLKHLYDFGDVRSHASEEM